MLADFPAMATLPTADMARARAFYEGLGFPVVREGDELQGTMFQAGSTPFLVFATPNAGTNHATAMAFTVSDEGFAGEIEGLHRFRAKLVANLPRLRGHDLQCWCPLSSRWCHADVLLKLANEPLPDLASAA